MKKIEENNQIENEKPKRSLFGNFDWKKMLILGVLLLLLWVGVLFFMIKYGETLRTDPCSSCAKKMGDEVVCGFRDIATMGDITKTFYENGSIKLTSSKFIG